MVFVDQYCTEPRNSTNQSCAGFAVVDFDSCAAQRGRVKTWWYNKYADIHLTSPNEEDGACTFLCGCYAPRLKPTSDFCATFMEESNVSYNIFGTKDRPDDTRTDVVFFDYKDAGSQICSRGSNDVCEQCRQGEGDLSRDCSDPSLVPPNISACHSCYAQWKCYACNLVQDGACYQGYEMLQQLATVQNRDHLGFDFLRCVHMINGTKMA